MHYYKYDGNGPEQQQDWYVTTKLTNFQIKLPTLLSLVRVRRPAVLAGVAGAGHRLLRLVRGLLPGLLLAGDRRRRRQGQVGRLRGTQGAQVVPAQAGRQRQGVLQIFVLMWCGLWSGVWCVV